MSRPIRYCGDYQGRNVRFARQVARDGIRSEAPEADRIIGWGCAAGITVYGGFALVEVL